VNERSSSSGLPYTNVPVGIVNKTTATDHRSALSPSKASESLRPGVSLEAPPFNGRLRGPGSFLPCRAPLPGRSACACLRPCRSPLASACDLRVAASSDRTNNARAQWTCNQVDIFFRSAGPGGYLGGEVRATGKRPVPSCDFDGQVQPAAIVTLPRRWWWVSDHRLA
jgi:hypothetical protein